MPAIGTPSGAYTSLGESYQYLESALNNLRLVPFSDSGRSIPTDQERRYRFNQAAVAVQEARARLNLL